MQSWSFRSYVLSNEISLNNIANHFGINKKFKWEEPLVLSNSALDGIIRDAQDKYVYLYNFGALVFINMEFHQIQDFVKYLKSIDPMLMNNNITDDLMDEYKLEIDHDYEYMLYNDLMTSNEFLDYDLDIISLILAKSTCLEKIEKDTDKLLDSIENIITYLDNGKFNMSDKQIAKTSAKVLRFKYNTISNLQLLDKPSAAWLNEDIEKFFIELSSLFEIQDRFEKIYHKTQVLQDITDVFSSLTHEKRGTKLEIMVIVLILFELLISIIEFYLKFKGI